MKTSVSKRVSLLRRTLEYINARKWDEQDGRIVFGTTFAEIEEGFAFPESDEADGDPPIVQAIGTLGANILRERGQAELTGRLSISPPPKTNALDNFLCDVAHLSADDQENLQVILVTTQIENHEKRSPTEAQIAAKNRDALEARLLDEMLGKTPKAVDRAFSLEQLSLESTPPNVQRYFEEAHKCYVYGFPVACAVLCRALIESALKQKCDPDSTIRKQTAKTESYLLRLAREAINTRRIKTVSGDDCEAIILAGNNVAHGLEGFEKKWEPKVPENLKNTRLILNDLYSKSEV